MQGSSLQTYRASDGTLLWTENAWFLFVDRGVTYLLDKPNSGNTMLIAHSDRSPAILWQRSLGTGNVNTGCLFPVNSVLYCTRADGHVLYAFKAPNGSLLWKYDFKGAISWIVGVTNGIVYVTTTSTRNWQNILGNYAFDAGTGKVLWSF